VRRDGPGGVREHSRGLAAAQARKGDHAMTRACDAPPPFAGPVRTGTRPTDPESHTDPPPPVTTGPRAPQAHKLAAGALTPTRR
jgi:hypothetical protein